ncbi:uncharacterized protein LOC129729101 [Wyeomyia smithii]|uniref:uncharacterized protein LOC129729101 n=1 Tax=Wyeomyia smithii TaxID=174621 RepID=UPI00246804EB|nr:uncharacterized protein LOC129729101 [Wyeomyia smithii]
MASDAENKEIFAEYVVDEEIIELLKSFNFSSANGYDVESLKIIKREEVEAVLQSPLLAERTKCLDGLNKWRIALGLCPVTTPLKSTNPSNINNPDSPKTELRNLPRNQWTALSLIKRSKKGRYILENINSTKALSRTGRKFITHLIIDEFVDEFGKLKQEELTLRSEELKHIFPSVDQYVWYQPRIKVGENGKKIKISNTAKGCLYDRNHNYKQVPKSAAASPALDLPSSSSTQPFVDLFTEESVIKYQATKIWFRHHHGEWDDVNKRWEETSAFRLQEISRLESVTYQKLLDEYPVLRNSIGYQLVKLDFGFKYPTRSNLLYSNFALFRSRAKSIFRNEVPKQMKPLLVLLLNEVLSEGFYLSIFEKCFTLERSQI